MAFSTAAWSQKLKTLFVLGFPNPFAGAAWTRIGFFAEFWSKKGHEVDVLGAFSYKSLQKRGSGRFDKVNLFNLIFSMNIHHSFIFTINNLMSFIVSTLFLLAKRPHIAIISVPSKDIELGALLACKLIGVKCVVDYRDQWEDYAVSLTNHKSEKLFYSAMKKLACCLYAKARLVTAVTSNYTGALELRGLTNVKLIPNGADVKTFKPLVARKDATAFKMSYSGGVGGYYKLDIIVKSIRRLVDNGLRNITLVIVGAGEIQKILNLATQLDISDHIDYRGVIDDKTQLAELIAKADVGLIPYDDNLLWKDSLPAKFFEYCACGLPVIATAYEDSLIARLISDHEIGATSPPMDEEKLAEAIYQLYKNESFREAAGKRARALVEENFDRNKIAAEFLNLVRELT